MTLERSGPILLTVAGHDPSYRFEAGRGRGAGVDADREAASHFGCASLSVVTAWTEQEAGRVLELGPVTPMVWLQEALGLLAELRDQLGALKFGLLPGEAAVRAAATLVREARKRLPQLPVVVDPVLAASGGEPFLDGAGQRALLEDLLPQGVVVTPNRPEAAQLFGAPLDADPEQLAAKLFAATAARSPAAGRLRGVVLKGGHGGEDPVRDLVLDHTGTLAVHQHARRVGRSLHGSGCRHASAVAVGLAQGLVLSAAAGRAGDWLADLIADA